MPQPLLHISTTKDQCTQSTTSSTADEAARGTSCKVCMCEPKPSYKWSNCRHIRETFANRDKCSQNIREMTSSRVLSFVHAHKREHERKWNYAEQKVCKIGGRVVWWSCTALCLPWLQMLATIANISKWRAGVKSDPIVYWDVRGQTTIKSRTQK